MRAVCPGATVTPKSSSATYRSSSAVKKLSTSYAKQPEKNRQRMRFWCIYVLHWLTVNIQTILRIRAGMCENLPLHACYLELDASATSQGSDDLAHPHSIVLAYFVRMENYGYTHVPNIGPLAT